MNKPFIHTEDYCSLTEERPKSLLEVMHSFPGGDFEFEFPKMDLTGFHDTDLREEDEL